jgi:hypothetical protein
VIAAHAVSGDGTKDKMDLFRAGNVQRLPIPDYSEGYPHLPYTLGLVGTGPSFYVNKIFNTQHHDACFGTVVIGRETIDAMAALPGEASDPTRIRAVDIVSARLANVQHLSDASRLEYLANTRR